jgi:hypothetical protein
MTHQEIRKEILEGPLSREIAPCLTMVFNDLEPIRSKLPHRQGMLTPDGAFEILRILNDPTKRPKKNTVVNSVDFIKALYPLFFKIAKLSQTRQDYWNLMLKLVSENQIEISKSQINDLIEMAIVDNIMDKELKQSLLNLFVDGTQSRLNELGWNLTNEDIQSASAGGI